VDTLGLILAVVVHAASEQDRDGAKLVFWRARPKFAGLKLVWADGGYGGQLVEWVSVFCKFALAIVRRPQEQKGFVLLKRRWIVERTFGWLGRFRRLSKDYEYLSQSSETMIHVAMISLMLNRLRPRKRR
jgi:putative transposase